MKLEIQQLYVHRDEMKTKNLENAAALK